MAINKRIIRSNDEAAAGASFNTVTYTGNGGTQSITGVGFQPDFTWIKIRTNIDNHVLQDSVRGVGKGLFSDLTNAENASMGGMTSFDSDGFTFDGSIVSLNQSGQNFVAWCWKAGGSAVTNTDGTITSQVSANPAAGFSIITFTTPGTSNWTGTLGHGLNEAPEIFITKSRTQTINWWTFTNLITPSPAALKLNSTDAAINADSIEAGISFNQNTIGVNKAFTQGGTSAEDLVVYAFHSVAGFSKFGSYDGTGASGNSVVTGFEPAFVMGKCIDTTTSSGDWYMVDNKRLNNTTLYPLYANLSNAEQQVDVINFNSNGFTVENTSDNFNASGKTYIYMAFANQF